MDLKPLTLHDVVAVGVVGVVPLGKKYTHTVTVPGLSKLL